MNKAFTLLEMLIAITISALVVMGTYNLFNTVVNVRYSTSGNNVYSQINTSLTLMINKDFNSFISGDDDSDNATNVMPGTLQEQNNSSEKKNQVYSQNLILNNSGRFPRIILKTHNSIFFNQATPAMVTYYVDDNNYLVRSEDIAALDFNEKMRLIGGIKEFKVFSFNGKKYIENEINPSLIKLVIKIDKYDYEIITGILNEQQR